MEKYCVGYVVHNPDIIRLKKSIDNIRLQSPKIYVYLNSDLDIEYLSFTDIDDITFLGTEINLGLAIGLNAISNQAMEDGYQWILFLDQDSIIQSNVFGEYFKYINLLDVGLISPRVVEEKLIEDPPTHSDREITYINNHITSGSFIKLSALNLVGMFDNDFFIDSIDTDLSIRLSLNGIKQVRVNSVKMLHQTGDIENSKLKIIAIRDGRVSIKSLTRTNHSETRVRYIFRNFVLMMKKYSKYKFSDFGLLLRLIYVPWIKSVLLLLLVERNKMVKFRILLSGTMEGFKTRVKKYKTQKAN